MSRSSYPLKLPASLKREAQRLAKDDGVSLNQWISIAVAQQITAQETTAAFLRRYAGEASPQDMLALLAKVPGADPLPGDELPAACAPRRNAPEPA